LNFYFQLANEKNTVTLLRLNDTLGKICSAENFDANHVNSITAFDDEKYIFKNDLYVVKANVDSTGKQFFVSKYSVKDMLSPFEYDYKWQFAFERQYIHRASVIYADSLYVIVYAHVDEGIKKGQWILRLRAQTGELVKGTKLNNSGADNRHFLLSHFIYDPKSTNIDVIGSIYNPDMIDFKTGSSNFVTLSKRHQFFIISINSSGDITTRSEKLFAMPIQTNKVSFVTSYHYKIRGFKKNRDSSYDIWADVYDQTSPNVFVYFSSWHMTAIKNEIDYEFNPSVFYNATDAIPRFIGYDKGDNYGKYMLNSITDYDKLKYKKPMNDVVYKLAQDELDRSFFVLKKTDILQGTKTFYYVFVGKKGLEKKVIFTAPKNQKGDVYFIQNKKYLSFITDTTNTQFELQLQNL
jgi:hypothetical protein